MCGYVWVTNVGLSSVMFAEYQGVDLTWGAPMDDGAFAPYFKGLYLKKNPDSTMTRQTVIDNIRRAIDARAAVQSRYGYGIWGPPRTYASYRSPF